MDNRACKECTLQNVASTVTAASTNVSSSSNRSSGGDHRGSSHSSSRTNRGLGSGRGNNSDCGGWYRQEYGRDWDRQYRHLSNYHCDDRDNDRRYDDCRGNSRDDRRSHHNIRNGNDDRCGVHMGHSHHMSEESSRYNSCGRSPSRIRIRVRMPLLSRSHSRIPSKICSRSTSHSVDAYHIMGVYDVHKSPSPSPERLPDGEESEKFQDLWIN